MEEYRAASVLVVVWALQRRWRLRRMWEELHHSVPLDCPFLLHRCTNSLVSPAASCGLGRQASGHGTKTDTAPCSDVAPDIVEGLPRHEPRETESVLVTVKMSLVEALWLGPQGHKVQQVAQA
eukprot:5109-Eustigmatos_ZCMA.PRE.1